MSRTSTILCITEGKKPDIKIVEKTADLFLGEKVQIEYISENIYSLFEEIQKNIDEIGDTDIDTFSIIKKRYQRKGQSFFNEVDRSKITAIYLFFDYDGHDHRAQSTEDLGVSKITAMLEMFNDAQEKGSLFISYPMTEAYRDEISDSVKTVSILDCNDYKELTGNNNQSIVDTRNWTKEICVEIFQKHLATANYLINGQFNIPAPETNVENFSQNHILNEQYKQFIEPVQTIAILSCLPLFVFEHRGKRILEEWQD